MWNFCVSVLISVNAKQIFSCCPISLTIWFSLNCYSSIKTLQKYTHVMSSSCFSGLKMKLLSVCIYGVYVNRMTFIWIFTSEAQTLLFVLFNCANNCADERQHYPECVVQHKCRGWITWMSHETFLPLKVLNPHEQSQLSWISCSYYCDLWPL